MQRTVTYYKFRQNMEDLRQMLGERSNASLIRLLDLPDKTYKNPAEKRLKFASAKAFSDAFSAALHKAKGKKISFHDIFEPVSLIQDLPDQDSDKLDPKDIDPNEFYTTSQASDILGIQPDSVKMRCNRGTIPAKKVGKQWMIAGSYLLEVTS